jgi:hypothetical protein
MDKDKKKFYNKVCVISYVGVGISFVGFVLGGMASVGSAEPKFAAILIPFFGFGIFGMLAAFAYRNSEFRDRHLRSTGESLGFINSEKQVLIRCRFCDHLNDENAKYCNECGNKL